MKTNTNIKRRVKHSIKHRAQRKHKTHKNTHTKTQLKQHKTHIGGANSNAESFQKRIDKHNAEQYTITPDNINDFIAEYPEPNAITLNNKNIWICINFININDDNFIKINKCIDIIARSLQNLTEISLTNCNNLTKLPEAIGNLTQLTMLSLYYCVSLIKLPKEIGKLTNLTNLILNNCSMLETLPKEIGKLTNLTNLILNNCSMLKTLPEEIGGLDKLTKLDLTKCSMLKTLPKEIGEITQIKTLVLTDCTGLITLPQEICKLTNLEKLDLENCSELQILQYTLVLLKNLYTLNIKGCKKILYFPETLWLLTNLSALYYDADTIQNPEILYLLPLFVLKLMYADNYRDKITGNTNPKSMYNIPIKDFLVPFRESTFAEYAPLEQNKLLSTLALGQQKQTPGVNYADNLFQVFQSTYINKIPYELDPDKSIKEQIAIFTGLRSNNLSIRYGYHNR